MDILERYNGWDEFNGGGPAWMYRMINSERPLEEKLSLFWHHVFATSSGKSEHTPSSVFQIETFRRNGLGDLRTIYLDLAREFGRRLVGLRDGEVVFDGDIADVTDETFRDIYGRAITDDDLPTLVKGSVLADDGDGPN